MGGISWRSNVAKAIDLDHGTMTTRLQNSNLYIIRILPARPK
jgi:hypothetical protein